MFYIFLKINKMNTQEETYLISDSEHINGTNRYTFTYSPHWRRTNQKALNIAIRSVKQINSTRAIWLDNILLVDNLNNYMPIDTDISLNGNWVKFNEQLNEYRQRQFNNFKNINPSTKFTSEDYAINYEEERARLNIKVNESNIDKYKIVCDNNFKISPEILAMCGYNKNIEELEQDLISLSNNNLTEIQFKNKHIGDPIEIEMNKGNLIRISFINIWNRDTLKIHASFVDLSYHQWLGVCNEQFIPPKEYPIVFDDQKFWIELYTLYGKPVELPNDGKDQIIIEAMMNSYI